MTLTAGLVEVAGIVGLGALFAGVVILANPTPRARERPAPDKHRLAKCRGCGAEYHTSWGEFCSNCTGAD